MRMSRAHGIAGFGAGMLLVALVVCTGCVFNGDDGDKTKVVHYKLTGSVTDEWGNPVAGATIQTADGGYSATSTTNGTYELTGSDTVKKSADILDTLQVSHDMYQSGQQSVTQCTSQVNFALSYNPDSLVLKGNVIRVLKPSGDETYNKNDTMHVIWIFNSDSTDENVISFLQAGAFQATDYTASSSEWFKWPRDTLDTANLTPGELTPLNSDSTLVMGRAGIALKDTTILFSNLTFKDSMRVKVWDPYGETNAAIEGSYSDGWFSIEE